jgi:hypothetical protein
LFLGKVVSLEGREPEMSEKPGRASRMELLLQSNNKCRRTGKVRLRKLPIPFANEECFGD